MIETDFRPLTDWERQLLLGICDQEFDGREAVLEQIEMLVAKRIDDHGEMGCLKFIVNSGAPIPLRMGVVAESVFEDDDSTPVFLMLFVDEGKLDMLEIWKPGSGEYYPILRAPRIEDVIPSPQYWLESGLKSLEDEANAKLQPKRGSFHWWFSRVIKTRARTLFQIDQIEVDRRPPDRKPDFYLSCAGEMSGDMARVRACWTDGRIRDNSRDNGYMIIHVFPPVIGKGHGSGDHDLSQLIISPHLQGFSLFPVNHWPAPVYVMRIVDESVTKTGVVSKESVRMIGWGTLYRTFYEARAEVAGSASRPSQRWVRMATPPPDNRSWFRRWFSRP
jgi:hypothetical protein